MRFPLDNALSVRVEEPLCDKGHDAIHVRDEGLPFAKTKRPLLVANLPAVLKDLLAGCVVIIESDRLA